MRSEMLAPDVTLDHIRRAARALDGVVVRTPLLENPDVNALLGGRLLLKAENMQRTGAFKIRGAYHRLLGLAKDELARGTVSYSSGNHALGLAQAAQIMDTTAVIVMPSDAPAAKQAAVRAMGAEIVTYDRDTQDSADVVAQVIARTGRIEVPPSAHPEILAGAGTVALELLEDAGGDLDAVLVPCGGGGLTAATALVMEEGAPGTQVFAAEPALFDDTRRSLIAQERLPNPKGQRTICDAIMTPIPGDMTFSINRTRLAGGVTATDDEVRHAMRFAYQHFKIVTEPGAVVGLAAVLNGQVPIKGRTVATVITGGNIDAARFAELLSPSHTDLNGRRQL
ncbi:pyridoxal-5'-phosphate-dependent protein [Jannaschia sp. EhC01]|nr:pyridoxal-5'-phosphate-dependent protein [Jannaschia sp. EhC01]